MTNNLIEELNRIKGLQIECPNCKKTFPVKLAKLFDINDKYSPTIDKKIDQLNKMQKSQLEELDENKMGILERRKEIRAEPESTKKRRTKITESVNFGQIIEKIIPSIKNFPYEQKDCRALFDPIDYIVFNGLHKNGNINELSFIDVKSGNARLKTNQKEIKNTIDNRKVKYLNIEDIKNE
jgi:predicted Holliday junction resolvase-like endonuclease